MAFFRALRPEQSITPLPGAQSHAVDTGFAAQLANGKPALRKIQIILHGLFHLYKTNFCITIAYTFLFFVQERTACSPHWPAPRKRLCQAHPARPDTL